MKTDKKHERKREEFDRLCEKDFRTVSSALEKSTYLDNVEVVKLTKEEKGEITNLLYNYKRAESDVRHKYVKNCLFSYIEKLVSRRN